MRKNALSEIGSRDSEVDVLSSLGVNWNLDLIPIRAVSARQTALILQRLPFLKYGILALNGELTAAFSNGFRFQAQVATSGLVRDFPIAGLIIFSRKGDEKRVSVEERVTIKTKPIVHIPLCRTKPFGYRRRGSRIEEVKAAANDQDACAPIVISDAKERQSGMPSGETWSRARIKLKIDKACYEKVSLACLYFVFVEGVPSSSAGHFVRLSDDKRTRTCDLYRRARLCLRAIASHRRLWGGISARNDPLELLFILAHCCGNENQGQKESEGCEKTPTQDFHGNFLLFLLRITLVKSDENQGKREEACAEITLEKFRRNEPKKSHWSTRSALPHEGK